MSNGVVGKGGIGSPAGMWSPARDGKPSCREDVQLFVVLKIHSETLWGLNPPTVMRCESLSVSVFAFYGFVMKVDFYL